MKVICAGFWKTGTKSLANALEELGYKVYDYDYQCFELEELWGKFIDGTVTDDDIRDALKDIDVLVDGPVIAYWEEISRAIPDAKVILTIRDEDKWWDSYWRMAKKAPWFFKVAFPLLYLCPSARPIVRVGNRIFSICIGVEGPWRLTYNVDNNPRMYKNAFRKHNSHVLRSVPKEKLLVHQLGDEWKPLCEFLGHDVPDIPYPHKNKDSAHFNEEEAPKHPKFKRVVKEVTAAVALLVALLSFAVYYLISYVFN